MQDERDARIAKLEAQVALLIEENARLRARAAELEALSGSSSSSNHPPSSDIVPAPLLSRLIEAMRPEEIWLFGSRARGNARPDSDWDLLIVLPNEASEEQIDLGFTWQILRGLGIPTDAIPVRRSDLDWARDHVGTLEYTVVREGRRIYAR